MSEFCFHLISWEQIDGFWWNFVYTVLWLAHEIFLNFSTELWPLIDVKISIFRNNEWILIKFCWCIDICFPCCDYTHYFPKLFNSYVLWKNWWIWSNLVVTLIFLWQNICNNKNNYSGGVSCSVCNAFIIISSSSSSNSSSNSIIYIFQKLLRHEQQMEMFTPL